jgi:hypothetical protein
MLNKEQTTLVNSKGGQIMRSKLEGMLDKKQEYLFEKDRNKVTPNSVM